MENKKIKIPNLNTPLGQMEYYFNNVGYMLSRNPSPILANLSNFYHTAITALKN